MIRKLSKIKSSKILDLKFILAKEIFYDNTSLQMLV